MDPHSSRIVALLEHGNLYRQGLAFDSINTGYVYLQLFYGVAWLHEDNERPSKIMMNVQSGMVGRAVVMYNFVMPRVHPERAPTNPFSLTHPVYVCFESNLLGPISVSYLDKVGAQLRELVKDLYPHRR